MVEVWLFYMAAESSLIKALTIYGKSSQSNLKKLNCWRDDAIQSVADGKGGQLVSGSGNGTTFSVQASKLTNSEWFEALQFAIDRCESKKQSGVSIARFC